MDLSKAILRKGLALGAALLLIFAWSLPAAHAQLPGGTLDPLSVPKYVTPLLIPPKMPVAGILWDHNIGKFVDYYEIAVRQFQQQILPAGFEKTTVWSYGPAKALSPFAPKIFNAPSLTIEARRVGD